MSDNNLLGQRRLPIGPELVARSTARFSDCGTYRYVLRRHFGCAGELDACPVCWIMLNPSTADVIWDDQTAAKCRSFAARWGFNSITVVNLFALRATSPNHLKTHPDPIGPDNDFFIRDEALKSVQSGGIVVCAWGAHGIIQEREQEVILGALEGVTLHAIAFTKAGSPRHPLYLPGELVPVQWRPVK